MVFDYFVFFVDFFYFEFQVDQLVFVYFMDKKKGDFDFRIYKYIDF